MERLRETGDPLFADDVYAWRYGPVLPAVYRAYSYFGADPIVAAPERGVMLPPDADAVLYDDDDAVALLAHVCDEWRERPAWELVVEYHLLLS